jgi:teichuronic acid biosynthesis glycosyltransferase TuaG
MPRVSIIIPAFNAEAYIGETLRSVEGLTYADWEVVLADDCSTDRTVEIAASFGQRFKIVQASQNAGPAAARNLAITQSTGELLAFLDADDYWLPDYLEQEVGLFDAVRARDGALGIVACDARVLSGDRFLPRSYMEIVGFPDRVTTAGLLRFNPIFVSAMSPRAVVDEAGGFNPEIFGVEDRDLWLRIVELGYRVVANRSALAVYRLAAQSVSSNPASMARATQIFYRRALERGKLTRHERRIARRELRLQRAIERIASPNGTSLAHVARALPLFALVAAEHPNRWPSYARMLVRRKMRLSAFTA